MSNEISLSVSLGVANGLYTPPTWYETLTPSQAAIDASAGVMNLTTSFADIPLGSVSTLGYAMFKNCDLTNNIDLGIDQSGTFRNSMTLQPGEVSVFRWKQGVVPAAVAEAGTPKLAFWILQN